jgi:uncharacterized membrane protein
MMGRVFWIFTAAVLGLAIHLATVLYVPGVTFARNLSRLTAGAGSNSFFVMKPDAQSALVPMASAQDIVGLCLLDLSKGAVTVSAHVPKSLWDFAIYSESGQQSYGINDVQANGNFKVDVTKSKSLLQQINGKPEAEDATQIADVGWHAEILETKGIAVLWVPVPDALQRPALEKIVAESHCGAK